LNNGIFLGVESSPTGRAWRSRLDERGSARALAIAQRSVCLTAIARKVGDKRFKSSIGPTD
jgi:single-stranded-DNA-specific exonuclease